MGMNKKIDSPKKTQKLIFFSWQILDLYQFVFPTLNKKQKKSHCKD